VFGAWGASVTGVSAVDRYGEVKEFGFWDLGAPLYLEEAPKPAAAGGSGGGEGGEDSPRPPREELAGYEPLGDAAAQQAEAAADAEAAAAAAAARGRGSGSGDEEEGGGCEGGSGGGAADVAAGGDEEDDEAARYSPLPSSPTKRPAAAVAGAAPGTPPAGAGAAPGTPPAGGGAPGAPAPSTPPGGASRGAGGAALLTSLFARERRQLRPLLPIPVNPRRRGEPCAALTIACNGCISKTEDFFEPWRALPHGDDADRFALVFEAQALKVGGGRRRGWGWLGLGAGCSRPRPQVRLPPVASPPCRPQNLPRLTHCLPPLPPPGPNPAHRT
jgi:hypothetical protein